MDKNEKKAVECELKARKMVLKKIVSARKTFGAKIEAVKAEREQRKATLSEYKNEDEILDAYGWGFITEEEYDKLRKEFADGTEAIDNEVSPVEVADGILLGWEKILRSDIDSLEFDLLPPKKQEAIRQRNYEIALERKKRMEAKNNGA